MNVPGLSSSTLVPITANAGRLYRDAVQKCKGRPQMSYLLMLRRRMHSDASTSQQQRLLRQPRYCDRTFSTWRTSRTTTGRPIVKSSSFDEPSLLFDSSSSSSKLPARYHYRQQQFRNHRPNALFLQTSSFTTKPNPNLGEKRAETSETSKASLTDSPNFTQTQSSNNDAPATTSSSSEPKTTTKPPEVPAPAETSDPPIWTWVDRYLPSTWQPYAHLARLDKPIGTWLLLWPCCWSTALAHPASLVDQASLVALFGVGAFVMRGAGCTINDLVDQDIDQAVARTRTRPLAAGDVTRTQAVQFLALQLATGCAVLVSLPHTWYCFQWGVASLPLVFLYPTTKRYFAYPQLVLGLCFNWGAWMGWAATYGSMEWSTVAPLYLAGVTWTLVYDTIYAHQDKDDDAKLGLYSTALTFGSDENTQRQILHALGATTYLLWATAGYQAGMVNPALFGTGITTAYAHLVWQIQTADMQNPHNLASRFRSNAITGALVYGALLAGHPPVML